MIDYLEKKVIFENYIVNLRLEKIKNLSDKLSKVEIFQNIKLHIKKSRI